MLLRKHDRTRVRFPPPPLLKVMKMVRSKNRAQGFGKKEKYPYPSRHGSHSSMINEEQTAELDALFGNSLQVVLEDEKGFYITQKRRLDTGLADPNRYSRRK